MWLDHLGKSTERKRVVVVVVVVIAVVVVAFLIHSSAEHSERHQVCAPTPVHVQVQVQYIE